MYFDIVDLSVRGISGAPLKPRLEYSHIVDFTHVLLYYWHTNIENYSTMAKPNKDNAHKITIQGSYFASVGGHTERRPYEITHIYSTEMVNAGALSVFKNHLKQDLKKLYPDFGGTLETHSIKKAERLDGNPVTDIRLMTEGELLQYIADEGYPITVGVYRDTDHLRQAVMDYEKAISERDEEGFLRNQERLVTMRGNHVTMREMALQLNPEGPVMDGEDNEGAEDEDNAEDNAEQDTDFSPITAPAKALAAVAGGKGKANAKGKPKNTGI